MAYNSRGGQRQEPTADYDIQPDVPMQTFDFPESRGSNNGYAAETHIDVNFREGRENGTRLRRPHSHGAADVINQRSVAAMLTDELPSRQLEAKVMGRSKTLNRKKSMKHQRPGFATLRFRGDVNVEQAVENIISDPDLMVDDPDMAEIVQSEAIRGMHTNLRQKRIIKDQVARKGSRKGGKKPGAFKHLKYSIAISGRHFKQRIAEIGYSLDLWKGHIKTIEGHFGTGVTSYFLFLKWLFLINMPIFLVSFSFIILPQLLDTYLNKGGYHNMTAFTGQELLTGGGWFNKTEMYYGSYVNGPIEIIKGHQYQMPFAYLLAYLGYLLLCLIILAQSMSVSYRKNFIEGSGEFNFYYVAKVFCGWDHNIADPAAARLKQKSIYQELAEYLSGFKKEKGSSRPCGQMCCWLIFRLFTNLIVLSLLAGSAYLVYYISITQSLKTDVRLLSDMAMPLCITTINVILPFAFSIIASFENYDKPKWELYMTMVRTMLLKGVTFAVLIYFWFTEVPCTVKTLSEDITRQDTDRQCQDCWENFMGQQIYRLVLVDFVFTLLMTFLAEFVRRLMSQICFKAMGYPEFNIGRNTLDLIYSQALCWLGTFYCPFLSFINIIKLFIIFYVKRVSVMQNCVPSLKPWRAGRVHTIILGLLFSSFVMAAVAMVFSIIMIKPSVTCGPYIGQENPLAGVTALLNQWKESYDWLPKLLSIITSDGFLAMILILMCVLVYYFRIIMLGHKEMVQLLINQLALEGKDKMFLLRMLQDATNQGVGPESSVLSVPQDGGSNLGYASPLSPGGRAFAKTIVGDESVRASPNMPHKVRASKTPQTADSKKPETSSSTVSEIRPSGFQSPLSVSVEPEIQVEDLPIDDYYTQASARESFNPHYKDHSPRGPPPELFHSMNPSFVDDPNYNKPGPSNTAAHRDFYPEPETAVTPKQKTATKQDSPKKKKNK